MSATTFCQNSKMLDDRQVKSLATPLVGIINDFYKNPINEEEFQKWLLHVEKHAKD